jgi:hypothetical protein
MAVNLAPHQLEALEKIHNGSVLKGGVGVGKSRVALAYFFNKEAMGSIPINGQGTLKELREPKDIYIITTAKKRDELDWEHEAAKFRLSTLRAASFCGVKLTVDSWNNIPNYVEIKDAFFIFDEQRLVGSGAWVKAFIKIAKANRWIMLSATPGDTWMDYIPLFVANGFYKNRTEFLRTHVVFNNFSKFPKVDHYVEVGRLNKLRHQVLVEMPYERQTVRHVKNVIVEYDVEKFNRAVKDRWNMFEERPIKDVGELFIVMRKIANSDLSRLGAIMQLIEKHPRLIVFYNFNYELELLRTLGNTLEIKTAEWNGHKHEDLPKEDRYFYLVQYTAGAEGWNCVSTDAMVFYSLNYSYKINEQAKGRIDRLNTLYTDLYYYILRSNSPIDNAIVKSLAGKKNFNEKVFLKEKGWKY